MTTALDRIYPAKLLLFGEYTVLSGSQALAVPLDLWSGRWEMKPGHEVPATLSYFDWLSEQGMASEKAYQHMIDDHQAGWRYVADIPVGYGVGSSGALVAALFDRYLSDSVGGDMAKGAAMMARMESYFHGASSGMDPVISYSRHAVLKDEEGKFVFLDNTGWPPEWKVYLLDSGTNRQTAEWVKLFRRKLEDEEMSMRIKRQLVPMVDHAIYMYLSGEANMLSSCLDVISRFQREYFAEMVPEAIRTVWDQWADTPGVYFKLCGAGGGGFFLVISAGKAMPGLTGAIAVKE